MKHTFRSNSTDIPAEGPESLQIRGNLSTWGTWERLIPDQVGNDSASQKITDVHIRHYETAARFVNGKRVLDIACGTGYGSRMLRLAGASTVVGVDVSAEAVRYAEQRYQTPGVEFVCSDAQQFKSSEQFDVIVSFETIEHLRHPDKFLENIRSLLVPNGSFLLSVPLGETRHFDAYHLHIFSQKQIFALLKKAGFSVDLSRCDELFLSRFELLRGGQLYPETNPSVRDLFFTRRGWLALRDFVLRGGFDLPTLLVVARPIKS